MEIKNDIRKQIIIFSYFYKYQLSKYSDIELSAICSKNKNNFKIFQYLLKKKHHNDKVINKILKHTIKFINSTASVDTIKLLIENGANIDMKDRQGRTLLMSFIICCTTSNELEIIKFLIRKGINGGKQSCNQVNCQDVDLKTPMMLCFVWVLDYSKKYDIIKFLLDNKADIYIKNKYGKNILKIIENYNGINSEIYSLVFNYKNIKNDYLCEFDVNFIYKN